MKPRSLSTSKHLVLAQARSSWALISLSVLKYKSAPVWKEFGDNIIGITEYTGMTLTTAFARPVDVYDLRGRKVRSQATSLSGLPKGVYIVNGRKLVK